MLEPGDPVPSVGAENQHGEIVTPDLEGPTVPYFYPEDFTDGCTIEANDFRDALPDLRESTIAVYGGSLDDRTRTPPGGASRSCASRGSILL